MKMDTRKSKKENKKKKRQRKTDFYLNPLPARITVRIEWKTARTWGANEEPYPQHCTTWTTKEKKKQQTYKWISFIYASFFYVGRVELVVLLILFISSFIFFILINKWFFIAHWHKSHHHHHHRPIQQLKFSSSHSRFFFFFYLNEDKEGIIDSIPTVRHRHYLHFNNLT